MRLSFFKNTLLIVLPLTVFICFSCGSGNRDATDKKQEDVIIHDTVEIKKEKKEIVTGANRQDQYFKLLEGKRVGVVANQTSIIMDKTDPLEEGNLETVYYAIHLVDYLHGFDISVEKVFAPEHGFRGKADAGEYVQDGIDKKTGIPIISLYGKNKKPSPTQMKGLDVVVFDIQDVGVRFYTYISTMHYMMEACAEAGIPFIVLDRPNPNGHYVDGPTMKKEHTSFLGLHPIPLVHGMTIGEYAQMINGEGWLSDSLKCDLTVITMENYTHDTFYSVPVRPSPNLPNDTSINLYPSLGLLEGTNLNAGRGTEMQFQLIGSPFLPKEKYPYAYTPQPNFGAKYPKHKDAECNGLDLRDTPRMDRVDLTWIMDAYRNHAHKDKFFNTKNFTAHAGTEELQKQIEQGYTFREIRKTWLKDLEAFKEIRSKYLLYD
ncbi:DUF1343 domain-containing protein [Aureisphaera galaxeae]|uniref:exo-beta-N-acetylmuramidase NamZ family protein n=1 Tax=Aureisphaera galaxeae TaxID=1538023 RepID=UPI002350AD32|nr:DUF1343 domain-containing protein [Aureisphaera galaxeae]MDC8004478.1 DUF1343 domain-containing protein [Aureisphaera galaxeae]